MFSWQTFVQTTLLWKIQKKVCQKRSSEIVSQADFTERRNMRVKKDFLRIFSCVRFFSLPCYKKRSHDWWSRFEFDSDWIGEWGKNRKEEDGKARGNSSKTVKKILFFFIGKICHVLKFKIQGTFSATSKVPISGLPCPKNHVIFYRYIYFFSKKENSLCQCREQFGLFIIQIVLIIFLLWPHCI